MLTPQHPEYRALVPGQRHFSCEPLRATLSTADCARRWHAARGGSACHDCAIGRLHHGEHRHLAVAGAVELPQAVNSQRQRITGACLRCGRVGLRIIQCSGICVSCSNREHEWRKGRNSKGTPPVTFQSLAWWAISVSGTGGAVIRSMVEAQDLPEALGRVLRKLPDGGHVVADERSLSAWNEAAGQFEPVCAQCSTVGLVLERKRGDVLERHHWCCGGEPVGKGWEPAQVRARVFAMPVATMVAWLDASTELADETPGLWTPTGVLCAECDRGQLEGLLTAPGGRWRVRCGGCGVGE